MAQIFLSYSHGDATRADRLAHALEVAGHEVWWDRRIGAGASFSNAIDAALAAADLVIVLWSKHSIMSDWVKDEAATGRDSGRLVPVLIGKVQPPLGFRQYQSVPLSGRDGEQALLETISQRLTDTPGLAPRHAIRATINWRVVPGALALVMLAASGFWLWPRGDDGNMTTITIAPIASDPRSVAFARSVGADIGRIKTGPAGSLSLVDAASDEAASADYKVEIGSTTNGSDLRADLNLLAPKSGKLMWSGSVDIHGGTLVDLRQRVVGQVGEVLRCIAELRKPPRAPTAEVESLALSACAVPTRAEEAASLYRQITAAAPDYGPGWAGLALTEAERIPNVSTDERLAVIASTKNALRRAIALAPNAPATIAAMSRMMRFDADYASRLLTRLDKGVMLNPESAQLRSLHSDALLVAGRMRDAVAEAKRASDLNPYSQLALQGYIGALAYAGRTGPAFAELAKADKIWPGSTLLQDVRFLLDLRFGSPREALALLDDHGPASVGGEASNQAWRSFLEARASPSAARIDSALQDFRSRYRKDPTDIVGYVSAAGTFGRIDEAYRAFDNPLAIDSMRGGMEVLFRPYMAGFRADPRFIALTAKLGLLNYWEHSNRWPDFCTAVDAPYDCRKVAGALTQEQRQVTKVFD